MEECVLTMKNILQMWVDDTSDENELLFFQSFIDTINQSNSLNDFIEYLSPKRAHQLLYDFLKDEIKHAEEEEDYPRLDHLEQIALLISVYHNFITIS